LISELLSLTKPPQFVAFQSVRGNSAALSAQVLHEIPEQVLGYMAINRILPKQVCV
jgi:hypothetical protein